MEVFRAVLRAVRAYDFDMTRELPHLFENAVLWTAAACRVSRPAKTCRKIPKKTPLSAESYRSQDWRKYADSRGDPNRSSVAETKTRMSEILSELTSQSHVLKVVENSQCFLILIIPHLLVSTIRWQGNENTYLRKSWTDAFSSSSWGWCVCRARTSTRDEHACVCVWSCSIFRKKSYFSSLNFCRKKFGNLFTCECLFDVGEKISERY